MAHTRLESFLNLRAREGAHDSAGTFTLCPRRAVESMARHQLGPGMWILKVVQAAVAAGARSIEIQQTSQTTCVSMDLPRTWSSPEMERRFLSLERSQERSLEHLLTGLRDVGLGRGRAFCLKGPGEQPMAWDGENLFLGSEPVTITQLAVSHAPGGKPASHQEAARCNAEVAQTLQRFAYTCPASLTLDGRRLDGLQLCPTHGYGEAVHPFQVGWTSEGEPRFPLPPGTYERTKNQAQEAKPKSLRAISEPLERMALPTGKVSVAWVLSLQVGSKQVEGRAKTVLVPIPAKLYWIADGVVVDEELIPVETGVSAALFASAEGLLTDASGLALVRTSEREARFRQRLEEVVPHLHDGPWVSFEVWEQSQKNYCRAWGGSIIGGMILLTPLAKGAIFHWLLGVALGGTLLAAPGSSLDELNKEAASAMAELPGQLLPASDERLS